MLPRSSSSRSKHPECLLPHRAHTRSEAVGDRVEDEIERAVGEDTQVSHIALNRSERELFPLRHPSILSQLCRGVVQHSHTRAHRSQHGALVCSFALTVLLPRPRIIAQPQRPFQESSVAGPSRSNPPGMADAETVWGYGRP